MTEDKMFQKLCNTEIQQVPLLYILERHPVHKYIITEDWTAEDLDNFNDAYSYLISLIDEMRSELKRLENIKGNFEEILKIKYKSKGGSRVMTEDEKIINEFRESLQPLNIPKKTIDIITEALDRLHEEDEKRLIKLGIIIGEN